jgi:phosphate-selective porin OprO/OprP
MNAVVKAGVGAVALLWLGGSVVARADEKARADGKAAAPGQAAEAKPVDPAAEKPKPVVIVAASSEDGFVVRSENGSFRLQLKALVQFDGRFFLADGDKALTNSFLIRRARPIFQGTVARYFDFNITPDFGGTAVVLQDAYLDARPSAAFGVRIGKQKPPIGVEHLQSDTYLGFIERALPSGLVPNRDVGVQIHGDLRQGVVSYAVGLFDGTPDGASVDVGTGDGKALVGRLVLSPFKTQKSPLKGLSIGLGASTEKQAGASATLAGYRSGGFNPFFLSYAQGIGPSGTRARLAPELSYFSGPVGLLAEYVKSQARLTKTTTSGGVTTTSATHSLANEAWQATLAVFVTGDQPAFEGVKIKKPFDPAKGQWGGLQLAARVNGFTADPETFSLGWADPARSAQKAFAWGLGVNWYLNRNLKQVVSFERTTFTGGAAKGGDRPTENALLIRTQLSF